MALPNTLGGRPWDIVTAEAVYNNLPDETTLAIYGDLLRMLLDHVGATPDRLLIAELAATLHEGRQPFTDYDQLNRSGLGVQQALDEHRQAATGAGLDVLAATWAFLNDAVTTRMRLGQFVYRITERVTILDYHVRRSARAAEQDPFVAAFRLTDEQAHLVRTLLADGTRLTDALEFTAIL